MSRPSTRSRAACLLATTGLASLALGLPIGATADSPPPAPASHKIRLAAGDFVPGVGKAPQVEGIEAADALTGAERGEYVVQFRGPVLEQWKQAVTATGATLGGYLPDYAFVVRMNAAQAKQVRALTDVAWVGRYQPAWKLTDAAADKYDAGKPAVYRVQVAPGAVSRVVGEAKAAGAAVSATDGRTLLVAAKPGQLEAVAGIVGASYIDAYKLMEKHNESAGGVIIKGNTANTRGYNGSTQTVAVADTGLGGGTKATAHADIPESRVTQIRDWPGADQAFCVDSTSDGPQDVDSGHGTHVAGSVLSDGDANGVGKAPASAAKLVFQAVEDYADVYGLCDGQAEDGYLLTGLPNDLATLFQQAYTDGARIHSNSWGSADAGAYTDNASATDAFVNTHRDMLISFSAGNAGIDANSDGVIDNDSIGSPATGKNVLTVGASENEKASYACDQTLSYQAQTAKEQASFANKTCAQLGGTMPIPTWGAWWPDRYPAAPIKDDNQADNAEQMAAFSSRGPTDDNRIKPDVVAPGTWILSNYSDKFQQQYDAGTNPKNNKYQNDGYGFPFSSGYKYFSGTSMSNPTAAGGAAIVRDFYNKHHSHTTASAALVKGTLINGADDLLDENNDGADDNDFPIPNVHEGWGRINLDHSTDGTAKYVDEGTGLATNGVSTQTYSLEAGQPFKATLAYSDKEAAVNASVTLVNDLDLEVVAPDGTVYKGNVFNGGWSATGGAADRRNNVENVYIQNAAAGTWTVRVKGFNVPSGPQKFALVADGSFAGTGTNTNPTVTNPGHQSTEVGTAVSKQVQAADADGDVLSYAATGLPAGLSIGANNGLISGTPTTAGTSNVSVTVNDGRGGTASTSFTWTVTATGGGTCALQTNGTDFAIGDNTTVESPVTVSGCTGAASATAKVAVNIVHTYIGDLKVDLVAPDGSIYVLHNRTGSGTDNINTTYTVNLSAETANGTWKLRVNDNAGGDTGRLDTWSLDAGGGGGTTPTCAAQTNGTDVAIADNTTVESPVTISGCTGAASATAKVAVNIQHTYIGDLKVDLVAPDGSIYVLHNRSGGSADNINTTYTVNLSAETANGTWKLRVNDNAGGDTGKIDTWTLTP